MRYYLRSTNADRRVLGVADFPTGVWVEVPKGVWIELSSQPGWDGEQRRT